MVRALFTALVTFLTIGVNAQTQLSQNQFNELWGPVDTLISETPLSFGSTITEDGVTLIEADEGRAALSFNESGGEIIVDTQGNTYRSSVDNLNYSVGQDGNLVSGENLSFSSTISNRTTTIDELSFGGNSSEFRFELQNLNSTGVNPWGAQRFSFSRSDSEDNLEVTNLYVRREDGTFVEIGEGSYSSADKTFRLTNVAAQQNGVGLSADQVSLIRDGEQDLGNATNVFISDEAGQFVSIGTADIVASPDQRTFNLSTLSGSADGHTFSADSLDIVQSGNSEEAMATNVFIQNAGGDFVQIGEADYVSSDQSLAMTSVIGKHGNDYFSADQLNLMQQGNSDIGQGTNIFIENEKGEFVTVGTANVELSSDGSAISLSSITGEASGYNFKANSFDYSESGGDEVVKATGVFIRNANGDFVQVGEGDYSSVQERLELTSVIGGYEGVEFSADQLNLFKEGNSDIGTATKLFVSDGKNGFINVGTAHLEVGGDGNSLLLNALSGKSHGFSLSADRLNADSFGDEFSLNIDNAQVASATSSERLTFGGGVISGDTDRTSADVLNLSFSNDDISYNSDRLRASSDGSTLDLNTRGVLEVSGNRLDVAFEAAGVNRLSFGGPADDGGILIERNNAGFVTRAEGAVSLSTNDEGGISEVGVALGDAISFSATDADGNARELTASFSYDAAAGKFFLKTVFKDGDQTEIKVMPFTFSSEKVGEDAVAALSASIEKQNIEEYLNTMTGIIDLERINNFIALGNGRMQVRVGREQGMEFYYSNNNLMVGSDDSANRDSLDPNVAMSLGFFKRGADNSVRSGGVLLSADSSLKYNVEAGQLSFAGLDLPDSGQIPLTLGAYYRYEDDEGTAIFGTLGTSLAELGSVSAGVVIENSLSERMTSRVGLAVNSKSDVAVTVGLNITLGRVNSSKRNLRSNTFYDPSEAGDMARSLRDYSSTER